MRVFALIFCVLTMASPVTANPGAVEQVLSEPEVREVVNGTIAALDSHYLFADKVPAVKKALTSRLLQGDFDRQFTFGRLRQQLELSLFQLSGDSRFSILERQGVMSTHDIHSSSDEGAVENGLIDDNIGYVTFEGDIDYPTANQDIDSALAAISQASAVILDLRDATGISLAVSQYLLSYFFESKAPLADLHFAKGRTEHLQSLERVTSERFPAYVPVYVVTSSHVTGVWEFVAAALGKRDHAMVVGEQTMGVAVLTDTLPLSTHTKLRFARAYFTHPGTHDNWQDWGVVADEKTSASAGFEAAVSLARQALQSYKKSLVD